MSSASRSNSAYGSRILDRYIMGLALRPLLLAVAVVLIGLLLERVLRLVDVVSTAGGSLIMVAALAANLVPHYLGLALGAAFAIGIFRVTARFSDTSEMDALLASGVSILRFTWPLVKLGCVLAVVSFAVYGFLDPYSRYHYREILNATISRAWGAHPPAAVFIDAGNGFTVTADSVDETGKHLKKVFILHREDGNDDIATSETGELELTPDGRKIQLTLQNGLHVVDQANGSTNTARFRNMTLDRKFDLTAPPFRPRGDSERELTSIELWQQMRNSWTGDSDPDLAAEFYSRIVRSISLPFLPFLIVPLSLGARRSTRVTSLIVAGIIVVLYHNALQIGEGLASSGKGSPFVLSWLPLAIFVALSFWIFAKSAARPGDTPVSRMIIALQDFISRIRPFRRRRSTGARPA